LIRKVFDHFRSAVDIIYPLSCGGCGSPGAILCLNCRDLFRLVEASSSCPYCGRWLSTPDVCGACVEVPPPFELGYYGFYFEGPLREALLAFKFRGRKDVGRLLIRLLDKELKTMREGFDVIVPLPVTEKRLKERGFNQSYVMAEEIGAITGRPITCSCLYKQNETKDQYTLSREERRKNIRGAFAVRGPDAIRGKRVLLVDDLMTTGNTVSEASRKLLSAKARAVLIFALARTP
jgi:ComF family protein